MRRHELERRYLETGEGRERRVCLPVSPALVRAVPPEALVSSMLPTIGKVCRELSGRPDPAAPPELLSEREMRRIDAGAVLWRPGYVWLTFRLIDDPNAGADGFGEGGAWLFPDPD